MGADWICIYSISVLIIEQPQMQSINVHHCSYLCITNIVEEVHVRDTHGVFYGESVGIMIEGVPIICTYGEVRLHICVYTVHWKDVFPKSVCTTCF